MIDLLNADQHTDHHLFERVIEMHNSPTAETIASICGHGSPTFEERLVEAMFAAGIRQQGWGEDYRRRVALRVILECEAELRAASPRGKRDWYWKPKHQKRLAERMVEKANWAIVCILATDRVYRSLLDIETNGRNGLRNIVDKLAETAVDELYLEWLVWRYLPPKQCGRHFTTSMRDFILTGMAVIDRLRSLSPLPNGQ